MLVDAAPFTECHVLIPSKIEDLPSIRPRKHNQPTRLRDTFDSRVGVPLESDESGPLDPHELP